MPADPTGILGLLYSLSAEWREVSEAIVSPQSDIENEPCYQKATSEGREVRWVAQEKVRRMSREGWKPLTERDKLLRPTIFVDRKKELLAMVRVK